MGTPDSAAIGQPTRLCPVRGKNDLRHRLRLEGIGIGGKGLRRVDDLRAAEVGPLGEEVLPQISDSFELDWWKGRSTPLRRLQKLQFIGAEGADQKTRSVRK